MAPRTAASILEGERDRGSAPAGADDRAAVAAGGLGGATTLAGAFDGAGVLGARAAGTFGALGTRAFAIESAVGVLRQAGLSTLVLHWAGSVPFALAVPFLLHGFHKLPWRRMVTSV